MNHDERVKARAYERWEQEGRPDGRADDHWLQAEREVLANEEGLHQGISNHPVQEEVARQEQLPPRGKRKDAGEERGNSHAT
jgi:hypothetical protein